MKDERQWGRRTNRKYLFSARTHEMIYVNSQRGSTLTHTRAVFFLITYKSEKEKSV